MFLHKWPKTVSKIWDRPTIPLYWLQTSGNYRCTQEESAWPLITACDAWTAHEKVTVVQAQLRISSTLRIFLCRALIMISDSSWLTSLPRPLACRRGPRAGSRRGGRRNGRGRGLGRRLGKRFRNKLGWRLRKRFGKPPKTFPGRGPSAGAARAPLTPSSSGPDPDQSGPGQRRGPDAGGRRAESALTGARRAKRRTRASASRAVAAGDRAARHTHGASSGSRGI